MSVTLSKLVKKYVGPDGSVVPVVDIDFFQLLPGEQVALVGSSGSGKTTLLHLIAGILTPDSGSILFSVDGTTLPHAWQQTSTHERAAVVNYQPSPITQPQGVVDLTQLSEADRDVFRGRNLGYIFQTHHLLPGFTALENVLLGMSFGGQKHDPVWAKYLLEQVGLAERLHYKPSKLSVGQQQRVAAARALANRPKLVLADEPTGALDPVNAQQVLDLIRRLCNEVNAALLLVSHDLGIAGQLQRQVNLFDLNKSAVRQGARSQETVVRSQ